MNRAWAYIAVLLATIAPALAFAAPDAERGQELYIRTGCLGCRGASGRGGVGPVLTHTTLPLDTLLRQLRHPRFTPVAPPPITTKALARAPGDRAAGIP